MLATSSSGVWLYSLLGLSVGLLLNRVCRLLVEHYYTASAGQGPTTEDEGALRNSQRRALLLAIGTATGFGGLWLKFGASTQTLVLSVYYSVFVAIFVLDVEHRWVPNVLLLPTAVLAVGASVLSGHPPLQEALAGGLLGFVGFFLMAVLYRGALGAGDVKLAGLIGLVTGFPGVVVALTLGIIAGGVGAALLLLSRQKTRKSYIPYAPFLVTGAVATLFFETQILSQFPNLAGW